MPRQFIQNRVFLLLLLAGCFPLGGRAQYIHTGEGDFMDTTREVSTGCPLLNLYYYSVQGKYPKSSASILKDLQVFTASLHWQERGSGYLNFRFPVTCEGQVGRRVEVIQTNVQYQSCHFDPEMVRALYRFVRTLTQWKAVKLGNGQPISYYAFISFKIQDGKVINIIP